MTSVGPGPLGELDVQALINSRRQIHDLLSRTALETVADRVLVTLSLLSSRDDSWGVHVVAVGAALREGTDSLTVLEGFTRGNVEPIREFVPAGWSAEALDDFASTAQFVLYAFSTEALAAAAVSTPLIEHCLRQNGSQDQIRRCLRNGS